MVSCDHQRTTQPHHIKDSLAYDIESIKIIPSNDILELKSYHITSPFSCQNIDGIIAYNYRLHSLDLSGLLNGYKDTIKLSIKQFDAYQTFSVLICSSMYLIIYYLCCITP